MVSVDSYFLWSVAWVLPLMLAEVCGGAYLLLVPRRRRPARVAGLALLLLGAGHVTMFAARQLFLDWALTNGFPPWYNLVWRVGGALFGLLEAAALAVAVWSVLAGHGSAAGADDDE